MIDDAKITRIYVYQSSMLAGPPKEVEAMLEKERGELREMLDNLEKIRKETPPPDESQLYVQHDRTNFFLGFLPVCLFDRS